MQTPAEMRRYDGLVGMFSGKDIAAVGVSIGIERLFTVMSARMGDAMRATHTQVSHWVLAGTGTCREVGKSLDWTSRHRACCG